MSAPAQIPPTDPIDAFIERWGTAGGAEQANFQPFMVELCAALDLPAPEPAAGGSGTYRFEMQVWQPSDDGATKRLGRIDLYHRAHFIMEAKQGHQAPRQARLFEAKTEAERRANVRHSPGWQRYMQAAKGQAEGYARNLPDGDPYPPFLIVCDVGFCFDFYADFSGTGRHYTQFPDREGFRLYLTDLREPTMRDRLRALWRDPLALDPSRQRVTVTRDISALLAKLARDLEGPRDRPRHAPRTVADFLIRCIFCMFAQSVGLLPPGAFTHLLQQAKDHPEGFAPMLSELWARMDAGGYSTALNAMVKRFNGGMFSGNPSPLKADPDMLELLIRAAGKDWSLVEPAIFGTLLEGALDARERDSLGAHFTPRAFVERLVLPTVMEPLRADWDGAKALAEEQLEKGDRQAAAATLRAFHASLCGVKVLDPACGTGNFLYVTMELMKRLEGEVLDALANLLPGEGDRLAISGASVDPHQFLGIDKNARAVPVAELVLWIGYLQWHFRTHGQVPPAEPILRDFKNIVHADALLAYSSEEAARDAKGAPLSRWNGGTVLHPITGEAVPDPNGRELVMRPVKPKPAAWPEADFIVGNPPFIAGMNFRAELGDGYAEALWSTYPAVPQATDICLHFWWKAAQMLMAPRKGARPVRRFGYITTSSLVQVFARRVLAEAMASRKPLRLVFAIPDHPWSSAAGAAAVRIAMTVAEPAELNLRPGRLLRVVSEHDTGGDAPDVLFVEAEGAINSNLTIGADANAVKPLTANRRIAWDGVKLHGKGFIVSPSVARSLGLGKVPGLEAHIRPYRNGRDIQQRSRGMLVIDLFGLTADQARRQYPSVFQHVMLHVKPERDANNRSTYRDNWWIFGEPRRELRPALCNLPNYIATVDTAKHRIFSRLSSDVIVDDKVVVVATASDFHLGVLSSRFHVAWALAAGGRLGVGNDPVYIKTACFDPFPFPQANARQQATIGAIADELDAHRKAALARHPQLTLTILYNALEAVRAGRALTDAERDVHDAGGISILQLLHNRLDAAVADAYCWPVDLAPAEIVSRVVALNAERIAEEANGVVHWLRPEFQDAEGTRQRAAQSTLDVEAIVAEGAPPWPKDQAAQYVTLRAALAGGAASPADLARRFQGAPRSPRLRVMLRTLAALGQVREMGGRFAP